MEKKAINKQYKKERKNGGHYLFKSARMSTGENYEKAVEGFQQKMINDKKYDELSKKAFDAEMKRRKAYANENMTEKQNSQAMQKFKKLDEDARKARDMKDTYVKQQAKEYIDTIKEAKLKDLNITENKEIAKKYISSNFWDYYTDDNIEYNEDYIPEYYEPKKKWKKNTTSNYK